MNNKEAGFFEERAQLEYLVRQALPELIKSYGYGVKRKLIVWSVRCSNGGEPYTLAMVLSEFSERYPGLGFDYLVLAADFPTTVLETAKRGIYDEKSIERVPMILRKKYLLKSKDRTKGLVRVVPELRQLVRFRSVNFMDKALRFRETADIIFCRNVLSSIDPCGQVDLLRQLHSHLSPGGYIFLEQSEPLSMLNVPLVAVTSTIYRKLESGGR